MNKVKVENKKIVVTGQVLSEDMGTVPGKNTFRIGEKIIAKRTGLTDIRGRVIKIIPLSGGYIPEYNNEVVGKIIETQSTGWQVDIGAPYVAYLPLTEYSRAYMDTRRTDTTDLMREGDLVFVRVIKYTGTKSLLVSMRGRKYHKLSDGVLKKITPQKVPRLIGKKGSMITLIKDHTKTTIFVGPNGWVWVKGSNPEDELKAIKAIELVEANSHKQGLTEKIEQLLK
jgi:exosome complex component RRP4